MDNANNSSLNIHLNPQNLDAGLTGECAPVIQPDRTVVTDVVTDIAGGGPDDAKIRTTTSQVSCCMDRARAAERTPGFRVSDVLSQGGAGNTVGDIMSESQLCRDTSRLTLRYGRKPSIPWPGKPASFWRNVARKLGTSNHVSGLATRQKQSAAASNKLDKLWPLSEYNSQWCATDHPQHNESMTMTRPLFAASVLSLSCHAA